MYHDKVTNGAKAIAGTLANPLPLLGSTYQYGKGRYLEARKDPLEYGKFLGEVTAYGASLLIGGPQIKALSGTQKAQKSQKLQKTAQLGTASKASTFLPTNIFKWDAITRAISAPINNVKASLEAQTRIIRANANRMSLSRNKQFVDEINPVELEADANKLKTLLLNNDGITEEIILLAESVESRYSRLLEKVTPLPKQFTMKNLDACVTYNKPIPMTEEAVGLVAKMAGIDKDFKLEIIRMDGLINPKTMGKCTLDGTIRLYPKSFENVWELAETVGHEYTHFFQTKLYNVSSLEIAKKYKNAFEKAAEATERQWKEHFKMKYLEFLDQQLEENLLQLKKRYPAAMNS